MSVQCLLTTEKRMTRQGKNDILLIMTIWLTILNSYISINIEVRGMMTWHLHQAKEHHLPIGQKRVHGAAPAVNSHRDLPRTANFSMKLG